MTPAEIVVVGSYNRDLVLSVAHLPAPGETCLSLGRQESPGGKGSNQAVQAARCGARVAMLGAIGADASGDEAMAVWAAAGVETSGVVRLAEAGTGMAVILVDGDGENSIVVDSGANAHFSPEHVEAAAAQIAAARLVVAQLETPPAATRRAFELARASGVTTLLNAAPAPEALDPELLGLTDILVVNEGEGLALSGRQDPDAIAEALLPQVGAAVILTLGAQGARLYRKDGGPYSRAAHPVAVVDTTGAGDAFIGAFAARLAVDGDVRAALDWGVAAGCLACTALGAVTSFADRAAIAALAGVDG